MKIYEVGGSIRDELLGLKPKDRDYAVECSSWEELVSWVAETHSKIFLTKPEFATIRAQKADGVVYDYVMCRKDGVYSDSRHPDTVEPGTIEEDLARRDFTCNAIAREENGKLIDPFNGFKDCLSHKLKCVGYKANYYNTQDRMTEDALRTFRALRFGITKKLWMEDSLCFFIQQVQPEFFQSISKERIFEETKKMFEADTPKTLAWLTNTLNKKTRDWLFSEVISLTPKIRQ